MNFKAIITKTDEGYIGFIPAVPGCNTQGDTFEETLNNLQEALELCLEEAKENDDYNSQIEWPQKDIPQVLSLVDITVDNYNA